MRSSEGAINVVKALSPWFFAWILLFVVYDQLIQSKATLPTAEYLMYAVQLVADIFMLGSTYLAYRAQKNTFERRFFRLIFISMILGMCS